MTTKTNDRKKDGAITTIAKKTLGLETLEQQWSDRLDIREFGVWQIKEALGAAYEAGRTAATGAKR